MPTKRVRVTPTIPGDTPINSQEILAIIREHGDPAWCSDADRAVGRLFGTQMSQGIDENSRVWQQAASVAKEQFGVDLPRPERFSQAAAGHPPIPETVTATKLRALCRWARNTYGPYKAVEVLESTYKLDEVQETRPTWTFKVTVPAGAFSDGESAVNALDSDVSERIARTLYDYSDRVRMELVERADVPA